MNFKLPQNSLFAILLRSPWWMSFAIAIAFIALSKALLSDQYWAFGAIGSLVFIVIGVMALVKQWGQLSTAQVQTILEKISAMSWPDFSVKLEQALKSDGYTVQKIEVGGGQGASADFLATKKGRSTIISAKRWKAAKIGAEPLQALSKAGDERQAAECLYIGLGQLNEAAMAFAKSNNIKFMQGDALARLLKVV